MATGPGKYDAECTAARESTGAEALLLMVVNGRNGSGFAVQSMGGPMSLHGLCDVLERCAQDIRRDLPPRA